MIPDSKKLIGLGFQEFVNWSILDMEFVDGVERYCDGAGPSWSNPRPDLLVHIFGGARVLVETKHDGTGEGGCFVADRQMKAYRAHAADLGVPLLIATGATGGQTVHGVNEARFTKRLAIPAQSEGGPGLLYHYGLDPSLEVAMKELAK